MNRIRLDKFLSSQCNISRTDAKKALKQKRVTLNGAPAQKGEILVDPDADIVTLDARPVEYKKYLYLMLNKPQGVVSASSSPGDITVVDLVPERYSRQGLFPAGRLDKDTTGFVLITDDGAFAHDILSPARHVPKTYEVTLEREVTLGEREEIQNGMSLGGEKLKPARLEYLGRNQSLPQYEIVLTQGLYHQIKRMFSFFGNRVVFLHRSAIGEVPLDESLAPGECRELGPEELSKLKRKN